MHDVDDVDNPALVDVLGEFGDIAVGRLGQDLLGGADLDDVAVAQDAHPVADPQRLVQVVGDEQDRLVEFLLDDHQLVLHLAADERVEGAERLVHEQDRRIAAQRPGQADTLLHAAGEFSDGVLGVRLEADHRQRLQRFCVTFTLGNALHLEAVAGVVDDVPVGEQCEVLEDHAHLLAAECLKGRAA